MNEKSVPNEISRILLRYFRAGRVAPVSAAAIHLQDDLEYLRIQWALSSDVVGLVEYLLSHRHETQSNMEHVLCDDFGSIRGRIEPVRTIVRRRISGNSACVSYY